jgi:hypothetical protein
LIYQDKTPQKPDGKIKEKHHDSHFDSVLKYHLRKNPYEEKLDDMTYINANITLLKTLYEKPFKVNSYKEKSII